MTKLEGEGEAMDAVESTGPYTPGPDAVDISPNQDKGILKEILTPGEGSETPQTGNKVFVHYTGKLLDGTKFDSSVDRGEMFEFTLGKGHVIKAWDIGVATMKKGEKCVLTCASDYAYGKAGSPPKIPPEATLVFEVELIKWTLEDLSSKCDGGILRSIIKEGEGSDMPDDEATVEVHIIGKYGEKVFEDRELTFQLSEGDEHGIVRGLETALTHFKKGEVSKIVLAPSYAFGAAGKPEFNIPPNSEVEYEVTLKSFEKEKESWAMSSSEKLEQSEIVKNKGTKFFKGGDYKKAEKQYKKIVSYLQYESDLEGDDLTKRNSLLLAGYLNLAACYLKLNDFSKVIENSNKALEIDPSNAKGLFRRGQARLSSNDFELAQEDFQHLVEIEPDNKAAQKQIILCKQKLRHQIEKEKKLYKNMFEKLAKYNEKNGENAVSEDAKSESVSSTDQNGSADPINMSEPEGAKA